MDPKIESEFGRNHRPLDVVRPVCPDSSEMAPGQSKINSELKTGPPRNISESHKRQGAGGLVFLVTAAFSMFGVWFVGPRLVEEYHYAAAVGKNRGEYQNALDHLKGQPLSKVSLASQLVAQRIKPSVVRISVIKPVKDENGLGSGIIMSEDGHILTNAHVLEDGTQFKIQLHDRRNFNATIVGTDSISDLAILKIDAPNLIPATWGDSEDIHVGSIVWAVGSPYGFQQTVTSGIISGKHRLGDPRDPNFQKQTMLQTDAAVNPGNSGGPLVNDQGCVIGINTSIFGESFQGISFAVPSSTARFVYEELVANGEVTRGFLGVQPTQVRSRDAARFQLPDLDGARLRLVEADSPAYQAGIRRNDVIRSWDGVLIKEYNTLYRLAEVTRPNSRVKVTYLRNGKEFETEVTVGKLDSNGMPGFQRPRQRRPRNNENSRN